MMVAMKVAKMMMMILNRKIMGAFVKNVDKNSNDSLLKIILILDDVYKDDEDEYFNANKL